MDPSDISTLEQLACALDQLRRDLALSLRGLSSAAAKLPENQGRRPALPHSTAGDLLKGKSVPEVETMTSFLGACGVHGDAQRPWLLALERVVHQHQRCLPGAVRVRDARPRLLGVHAAIQVEQTKGRDRTERDRGDELPLYVQRDLDTDVRARLMAASRLGGFLLLVGESSAGKSRALFEAVRTVLPDRWLLHPANAAELRELSSQSTDRIVVWLDELQDYLDHPVGVPAGQIRGLLEAGTVLVATCWPDEYRKRTALPALGQPDPYANDRRLLDLADMLHVSDVFSADELRRAEELADTDRRIRVALDTPDAGFTQVMAAGPELIRHWEHAPAYSHAVITAALDARRVGAHAPLTRDYLAVAVPGYLNDRQIATAPSDWLDAALEDATTLLRGATAALAPVSAGMGCTAGFRVADYLHQHALRVRRVEPLPDAAWHALVHHHHPDDTKRLADNAQRRGREHESVALLENLIGRGDRNAAVELAQLKTDIGDVDGAVRVLRPHADRDTYVTWVLADLLADREEIDDAVQVLRVHADSDGYTAERLVELLTGAGQVGDALQILRTRADNGDENAAFRLANLLFEHENAQELRTRADNGDEHAAARLADLLREQGQVQDLRIRADSGDEHAAYRLASSLFEQEQVDDALQILRTHTGNNIAHKVAYLLQEQGQVQELRTRADNGDKQAAARLADLLREQGQVQELRIRADSGDEDAANCLATLLINLGQFDDAAQFLRTRADNDGKVAAFHLAYVLAKQEQVQELRTRADKGDIYAASKMVDLMTDKGQVEDAIQWLRSRADRGDIYAASQLSNLLASQGLHAELGREVTAGTKGAVQALRLAQARLSRSAARRPVQVRLNWLELEATTLRRRSDLAD
ncbi:hypothetical protein SAMN04488564_11722 [Lentzea waywayandensis]|uniref:Tetratricopeptide repeat-containing protein n=1 Tax=Lentzea waywayandensis TaxID=84724 RepID=A0A1I6FGR1_9PSEU|nr:hypothetical protein [Lentzea waywayandensis]SFR29098.1 hypothetical protein SAMN04488564_11722 [Lentzea waywayandensis]